MQVISGPVGHRHVHYEASPAASVGAQIRHFMTWVNQTPNEPGVLKAGLAHLWFLTLHPFENVNGRIARTIGELMFARAERGLQRFYNLSVQLERDRKQYYDYLRADPERHPRYNRVAHVVSDRCWASHTPGAN
jgi:Fic family protein